MRIAIATVRKEKTSKISKRGGRAPYYLIFNEKAELLETLSNPFKIGGGGAGIAAAKMLADKQVNILIAGAIGEKMQNALTKRNIKCYEKTGMAKQIIQEIINQQ